ncbi:MAG: DUF350 domain-containing protein [Candidatus Micrarchaeota archaeon]
MDLITLIMAIVAGLIQMVVGLVLAMGAVYLGLKAFDRMTKGINEMEELKKGNVAVAILMGAVILSIANVIPAGVASLTNSILPGMSMGMIVVAVIVGATKLVWSLLIAVLSVYIAIVILDKITTDIDEMKELEKGNVAVAVLMAGVLLAVSVVIQAGVQGITNAPSLDAAAVAGALGVQ